MFIDILIIRINSIQKELCTFLYSPLWRSIPDGAGMYQEITEIEDSHPFLYALKFSENIQFYFAVFPKNPIPILFSILQWNI